MGQLLMTIGDERIIASRYRILRELGRGGMGVVYLVEHLGTGDHLALKVLLQHAGASPEMVERFKREARAPARIKSEHVVKVTDADVAPELGGAPFLVMELLDGSDLEKLIETRGSLPPDEVLPLLRQAATALDKAHAIGVTHRDLKPENLFLHRRESGPPILKILDFGISKMSNVDDMASAGLTKSGAMMGTPLYMSPEQACGRINQIGPPTDIWAIGLIAYRLLTGQIYWQAETIAELMAYIITQPMVPPSHRSTVPPAFDAWFARSTDRDPSRRFRSVGEQIAALADVIAGVAPTWLLTGPSAPSSPTVGVSTTGVGLARSSPSLQSSVTPPPNSTVGIVVMVSGALALVAACVGLAINLSHHAHAQSPAAASQRDESTAFTSKKKIPEPESPAPAAVDAGLTTPPTTNAIPAAPPVSPSSKPLPVATSTSHKPTPNVVVPPATATKPEPIKKFDPSAP